MGIWEFLTGLFKPAADIIDELHTSEEEKLSVKAKLLEIQTAVVNQIIDYERPLSKHRSPCSLRRRPVTRG
jgi:hypothetical protein